MTSCNKSISDSTSPGQNHSFNPFSISAILSDEVGQKRSPPTSCSSNHYSVDPKKGSIHSPSNGHSSETPKRPRKSSYSFSSSKTPKMPQQPNYQALGTKVYESVRGGQHPASYYTPNKHPSTCQMNSNHISPFNPNLLVALGHHPSPNREEQDELFNETSLDMLSEVARYHSELSDADANSTTESTMRERLSNIKLLSTSEDVEASTSDARNASLHIRSRKTATPSILKRDKRRRRVSSGGSCMNSSGDEESSSSLRYAQSQLNAGFLSPLSSEKFTTNKDLGFSPSLFLSRPENSHGEPMPEVSSDSPTSSAPIPIPRPDSGASYDRTESRHAHCPRPWSSSPGYESDGPQSGTVSDHHNTSATLNRSRDDFVTSTPIKVDKENLRRGNSGSAAEQEGVAWSPTVQLGSGRKHLREANDYSTSNDAEAIKKPRLPTPTPKPPQQQHQQQSSKKSKARTKLSPLLENSYSPIFKEGHLPSPLTTALATTPTRGMSFGMIAPPTGASVLPQQVSAAQGVLSTLPSSSLPTAVSQPPRSFFPAPQTSRPTSLFGATTIGRGGGATMLGPQTLLSVSSPNHALSYGSFQSVAGLLNKDRLQLPPPAAQQSHSSHNHPMLNSISLSQLHSNSLTFNPLASACGAPQGVRAFSSNGGNGGVFTPANIVHPNYMPLMVNTPTQHLPPPSCLYAPYTSNSMVVEKTAEKMRLGSMSDKIHSVPPRFIFANNRSEKRSRLTEAINKSLSETPSQPSKLPEEWTKLACGQTRDQKTLTEKARMFLNFRPRQLTFSSDAD